jgi:uncharacterized membrane protein required for colicin V production
MSDELVLDILLGLIILLFAAIGFWRGAAKEGLVTAGIFFGAAIAASWARPWGADLDEIVDLRQGLAPLIVATAALLLSTLVLGYGAAAILATGHPPLAGRLVGVPLAAFNGALLLAYGLSYVERYLPDTGTRRIVDDSRISWFLLHQLGWFLVGSAGALGLLVLIGLVARHRRPDGMMPLDPGVARALDGNQAHQRPVRLPRAADDGKVEPVTRGFDPTTGRFAADAPDATESMPLVVPERGDGFDNGNRRAGRDLYDWSGAIDDGSADDGLAGGDTWRPRPADNPRPGPAKAPPPRYLPPGSFPAKRWWLAGETAGDASQDDRAGRGADRAIERTGRDSTASPWSSSGLAKGANRFPSTSRPRRCQVCDAELDGADRFCPRCGAPDR